MSNLLLPKFPETPREVQDTVKSALLDTLACIVTGARRWDSIRIFRHFESQFIASHNHGGSQTRILLSDVKVGSPAVAAMVAAAIAELHPAYPWIVEDNTGVRRHEHSPWVGAVASVFALSDYLHQHGGQAQPGSARPGPVNGPEFLTALLIAVETALRLWARGQGNVSMATCTSLGVAVMACHLLGAHDDATVDSALATIQATSPSHQEQSEWQPEPLLSGNCARVALEAVFLSRAGVHLTFPHPRPDHVTLADVRQVWAGELPWRVLGTRFRLFPCHSTALPALGCLEQLIKANKDTLGDGSVEIVGIEFSRPVCNGVSTDSPPHTLGSRLNSPLWPIVARLLRMDLPASSSSITAGEDGNDADREANRLWGQLKFIEGGVAPLTLRVKLGDSGDELRLASTADSPCVDRQLLEEKFGWLCSAVIGCDPTRIISEAIGRLETLEGDVSEVFALLYSRPPWD